MPRMANPFFPISPAEFGLRELVGGIVIYVYIAYTIMVLAQRLHTKDSWMAWLPFANLYLLTQMAKREWWWMLGFFIPYVNFFVIGFLWADISRHLHKNPWIGAAIVLPYVGMFVPGYLVLTTSRE